MRTGILKMILAVSLVFNLSVLGAAAYVYYLKSNYWVSPFGVKMRNDAFLFESLSLSPAQLKTMRDKAIPFRANLKVKREEIVSQRAHLFKLMRAEIPDQNVIKTTVDAISSLQGEVEMMVTTHILQEKNSLEKDQQQKFLDLIENARQQGRQPLSSNCVTPGEP